MFFNNYYPYYNNHNFHRNYYNNYMQNFNNVDSQKKILNRKIPIQYLLNPLSQTKLLIQVKIEVTNLICLVSLLKLMI